MGSVGRRSSGGGWSANIKLENLEETLNRMAPQNNKPKVFTSQPINRFGGLESYTIEYEDDNGYTQNWFKENSTFEKQIDAMNFTEQRAFIKWTEGHFMGGEQYAGFSNMTREDQRYTKIYDKILDKSVLDRPIVVRRMSTFELINNGSKKKLSLDEVQAMEGKEVTCIANLSTGAAAKGLGIGSDSRKPVDYEIHVPAGKGMGMWIGDGRINGWADAQREWMMNRDLVYRVGKARMEGEKMVVPIYVVGKLPHSYK